MRVVVQEGTQDQVAVQPCAPACLPNLRSTLSTSRSRPTVFRFSKTLPGRTAIRQTPQQSEFAHLLSLANIQTFMAWALQITKPKRPPQSIAPIASCCPGRV
jgi:hypothetical protein